jgi:macro domain-containing protein
MLEVKGNLWTYTPNGDEVDARVVTTNGSLKVNGLAVMGKGTALQAKSKFPDLPLLLGQKIKTHGNHVFRFKIGNNHLVTFPTKRNWYDKKSDEELIAQSFQELKLMVKAMGWKVIVMPKPGVGAGGLDWKELKHYLNLERSLDNSFFVIDR